MKIAVEVEPGVGAWGECRIGVISEEEAGREDVEAVGWRIWECVREMTGVPEEEWVLQEAVRRDLRGSGVGSAWKAVWRHGGV